MQVPPDVWVARCVNCFVEIAVLVDRAGDTDLRVGGEKQKKILKEDGKQFFSCFFLFLGKPKNQKGNLPQSKNRFFIFRFWQLIEFVVPKIEFKLLFALGFGGFSASLSLIIAGQWQVTHDDRLRLH